MQEVLSQINSSWPKDVIIRALYTKLAPFFQRDLKYFLASKDEQYQMYLNNFDGVSQTGVCKKLCEFYKDLFTTYDIESKVIKTNDHLVPHFALIVRGDKYWYFIDPLKDLMNNQAHLRTAFYGIRHPKKCKEVLLKYPYIFSLSLDYLQEIDEFTKHIQNGIYYDDYLSMLHECLTSNKAVYHLKRAGCPFDIKSVEDLVRGKIWAFSEFILPSVNIPGIYERDQFYDCVSHYIFTHPEKRRINIEMVDAKTLTLDYYSNNRTFTYHEEEKNGVKKFVLK